MCHKIIEIFMFVPVIMVTVIVIVFVFVFDSLIMCLNYLPLLSLFDDHRAIWEYLDLVYVNSMTQSFFARHGFSIVKTRLIFIGCIPFNAKHFTNKHCCLLGICLVNFVHYFVPLCLVIDCKIQLYKMLVRIKQV